LKITQGQGQPPLAGVAGDVTTTDSGAGLIAKWEAITDSAERVDFYRKHAAAIDAAWKTAPPKKGTENLKG
jgi:hypothetical protein